MPLAAALGLADEAFASEAWPLPALESGARRRSSASARSTTASASSSGELGVGVYTMSELDRRGVEPVVREALERVAGAAFVHVSLDMDVVDPDVAPGVGTPVRGGLSYREAHLAMELVAESGLLGSLEVVEVNPILDRENATAPARRRARRQRSRRADSLAARKASIAAARLLEGVPEDAVAAGHDRELEQVAQRAR